MDRIKEILARLVEIRALLNGSEEVDVDVLEKEIQTLTEERETLEKIEKRKNMANALNTGSVIPTQIMSPTGEQREEVVDKYNTLEYRQAFMEYCKTGVMAPEYRADASTALADAAAVIPRSILDEAIKKMTSYGNLFAKVRKTNVPGGIDIPIISLKPTASWIGATPSERQKITASTKVSFSYYGLECKVAVDLIASIVSLPSFETTITDLIVEAMTQAMDIAIIKGTGTGQPLGVSVDPRIPAAQVITLSAADFLKWASWKKKIFAKIPLAYRAGGSFIMAAGTFEGYIDGMVDSNEQPVGRINYGITDGPQERFGGKEVMLVEDDVILPYETAVTDDVVAIFCKLGDYCINSNMEMTMYRWLDHDTNQYVDKAILVADGMILDPNGVIVIKKGA